MHSLSISWFFIRITTFATNFFYQDISSFILKLCTHLYMYYLRRQKFNDDFIHSSQLELEKQIT